MIGISFPSIVVIRECCPGSDLFLFSSSSVLGSDIGPSLYNEAGLILISPLSIKGFMNCELPYLKRMSIEFGNFGRAGAEKSPLGHGSGRGKG